MLGSSHCVTVVLIHYFIVPVFHISFISLQAVQELNMLMNLQPVALMVSMFCRTTFSAL